MSIKRIPVCPFCNTEMRREQGTVTYGGVILPTEMTEPDSQGHKHVKSTWGFQLYICPECGFVALWRGEL